MVCMKYESMKSTNVLCALCFVLCALCSCFEDEKCRLTTKLAPQKHLIDYRQAIYPRVQMVEVDRLSDEELEKGSRSRLTNWS